MHLTAAKGAVSHATVAVRDPPAFGLVATVPRHAVGIVRISILRITWVPELRVRLGDILGGYAEEELGRCDRWLVTAGVDLWYQM